MNYYLYRVTNKVNGKIYVGVHKTKDLNDGYMGSGKILGFAIKKHGIENFEKEILEYFEDAASMFEREKEIVNEEFLLRNDVYNLRRGGYGGFDHINANGLRGGFITDTARQNGWAKMQEKGIWFTAEYREKHSVKAKKQNFGQAFKGKTHSEETRKRISDSTKETSRGERNSQHGSFWITDGISSKKCRGDIPGGWSRGRNMLP